MRKVTTSTITEEYYHPAGTIHISVSLLTRLLEWAKSEAKDDITVHKVIELIAEHAANGKLLTMDDYTLIVPDVIIPTKDMISE